ncbi:MAG TPA: FGGY family carbohydrate kinase [Clostridia bacterium]
MKVIGIDIGTTSICALVLQAETGDVLETCYLENDTFITTGQPWEKIQDQDRILEKITAMAGRLVGKHRPIDAIGLTGQMHGFLYVDAQGQAVSPLFTWQDNRGNCLYDGEKTYADTLSERTGYKLATGFGSVTHFYNRLNRIVPGQAVGLCSIQGYAAMRLTGRAAPILHVSDAAGFGLFDLENARFDREALQLAGLDPGIFPEVTDRCGIIGHTPDGIPVVVAIGDNQASFIGAVKDMKSSVLVNVGTGSQISMLSETYRRDKAMETRPLMGSGCLLVGSPLCGGRSYQLLESFFHSVVDMAGLSCPRLYPAMDALAETFESLEDPLAVSTQFSGTREEPAQRGEIREIGTGNFTARHMIVGVLEGMTDELYQYYSLLEKQPGSALPTVLVGSGNGIRKNAVLQRLLSRKFGMPLKIPLYKEEAAYGAALFAGLGTGLYKSIEHAQSMIRYQD